MKSMTGFGKADYSYKTKKVLIEIRALNSKSADVLVKLPNYYRECELPLRNLLNQELQRGKIELFVSIEEDASPSVSSLNHHVIKAYYEQIKAISDEANIPLPDEILGTILRLPEAVSTPIQKLDEEEVALLQQKTLEAINQLSAFRTQEGEALKNDLKNSLNAIEAHLNEVEKLEAERMEIIKQRLKHNLDQLDFMIDQNRMEQELIYYLEKMDINEEKVRLRNHCTYFRNTLDETEAIGKKLGFIAQEMGREINTIGSKANHSEMQRYVVKMKDELEKIKEQVLNIL